MFNLKNGVTMLSILIFCIFFAGFSYAREPGASIKLGTMNMKTYLVGPDDPNPPLFSPRIYPYPMQTEITRNSVDSAQKITTLENEFIKVLILPEIGGRLLGAMDKTNNNFDFLYFNKVVKPALIALRGAWLSGGIEWNFPSFGHTVSTVAPMHHKIVENPDGSVTCYVGEVEFVRRMRWTVGMTLYPDKSYMKIVTTLYNRTPTHNNAYFWQNAAVHATDDLQVIFPPTNYTMPFGGYRIYPWPIHKGADVSWYKNTPEAEDYFCGIPGEYNGAYYHDGDYGTVHYANKFDCPGRKFFTWGTSDAGEIWIDILTDSDGQYIEIQNGRLPTQGDTWIFEPFAVEQWVDYWYPVKKMKGFVKANERAAVNCVQKDDGIFIAVNVTERMENLKLVLKGDGTKLYSTEIADLTPHGHFNYLVSTLEKPAVPELVLYAHDGTEIIHYIKEVVDTPIPDSKKVVKPTPDMSAQELYLIGYDREKRWKPYEAVELYKKALEKDPKLTDALHRLGIYYYKTAQFERAAESFGRVLSLNDDHHDARYYRALASLQLDNEKPAEEDFWKVSRRSAFRAPAFFMLARMSMKRGDFQQAEEFIQRSLHNAPDNFKAAGIRTAILRHMEKFSEAEILIKDLFEKDPLNMLAISESYFLHKAQGLDVIARSAGNELKKFLYRGPQDYIELAVDYAECGLLDEAIEILEMGVEVSPCRHTYPILYYYLGYYSGLQGKQWKTQSFFDKAAKQSPDYVFPNRFETIAVLLEAVKQNPDDWKAYYYLGNYLTAKNQWKEGLLKYYEAEQAGGNYGALFRNMGLVYLQKGRNLQKAAEYYKKAISARCDDYRYYLDLNEIYRNLGLIDERKALFQKMPSEVLENFNTLLGLTNLQTELGEYDKAIQILEENTFHPWELWTGARRAYHIAHFCRGVERMLEGLYYSACEDFMAVEIFPRNLGTGKRHDAVFPRENYFIGVSYEKLGQIEKAKDFFTSTASYSAAEFSEDNCFKTLAKLKLDDSEGKTILHSILSEAGDRITENRKDDTALYLAGLAYFGLGDTARALQSLQECLKLNPYNLSAKMAAKCMMP